MPSATESPRALGVILLSATIGAAAALMIALSFAANDVAILSATLAALAGLATLPLLHLTLSRQQVEAVIWTLASFALALTFVDINFGFRRGWPYTVLANGFRVSLSDILILLLAFFWLVSPRRRRADEAVPKFLFLAMTLMLLWDVINVLAIVRAPFFGWSLYWREVKAVLMLWFLAHYLEPRHLRLLGYGLAAVVLLEGVAVLDQMTVQAIFTEKLLKSEYALKSAAGSGYVLRYGGTFGHPNTLANFLAVALLYLWFFIPSLKKHPRGRLFVLIALAVGLITITVTGSRAAWMGFGLALALGMLLWMHKNGKNVVMGGLVMFFSITALTASLLALSPTFRDRLTKEDRGSAMVRAPLAETAQNIIAAHPLTGIGLGQYTQEMHRFDRTQLQVASWYNQPVHNFVLLTAAEVGIPGLLLHLAVFALILWYGWQTFRAGSGLFADIGLTALGGGLAWAIQEQANPDYLFMPYYLWVIWGAMLAARRIERHRGLAPQ
jgi:O-antigen ligase